MISPTLRMMTFPHVRNSSIQKSAEKGPPVVSAEAQIDRLWREFQNPRIEGPDPADWTHWHGLAALGAVECWKVWGF